MNPAKPGYSLFNADSLEMPVLLSVPHAGRDYPQEIFPLLRLPPASLLRLEDRYADLLAREAISRSVPAIIAHRARAWIDLNRDECDIDAEMTTGFTRANRISPGSKQRGGLGLIPRRLSGEGDIWKRQIPIAEVEARIAFFHRPYHAEIERILSQMIAKFGVAILLDLHSMPPVAHGIAGAPPRFVLGDCFGRSSAGRFVELLAGQIRLGGFAVSLNHPYSGDYILRRHGNAGSNVHAIQLEVDRSLYLDQHLREPDMGVAAISRLVARLVSELADDALGRKTLIAAE